MELLTGFIVGLFGSFHCIGMCGPIALALPLGRGNVYTGRMLYNIGRKFTYSVLGLLFGLLGGRVSMFGLQQTLTIALGITILISVFLPRKYKTIIADRSGFYRIFGRVKSSLGTLLQNHSMLSLFGIGVLNGLLPCGFVYIGLSGATALGEPVNGMLFMMMFGLGTLPVMFGTSLAGGFANIKLRAKLLKMVPVFSLILAATFILRGLNLGIPYISPRLGDKMIQKTEDVNCH
jgi:sulfite exporter TauE/SafE